jgi:hypothetical protein
MSITTFRLAREQEEAKLQVGTEVEAPVADPAPVPAEEPKKAPVSAAKPKTTTVKG